MTAQSLPHEELCWLEWLLRSLRKRAKQHVSIAFASRYKCSLLSGWQSCIRLFFLFQTAARVLHVDTPNDENYHPMWLANGPGTTSLVFRVKAKSDATIYLAEYQGVSLDSAYQIIIGAFSNTKYVAVIFVLTSSILSSNAYAAKCSLFYGTTCRTLIRRARADGGNTDAETDTPNIVTYDKLQPFWLSWSGGLIRVGEGHIVGDRELLQWQDPNPRSVHDITVSTGWGANGHWEFDSYEGVLADHFSGFCQRIICAL